MMVPINRKPLMKFMINDDIDGLAEYIEKLVKSEYDDGQRYGFYNGYNKGLNDGYNYRITEEK